MRRIVINIPDEEGLYDIVEEGKDRDLSEKDLFEIQYHVMMLKKFIDDIVSLEARYEEHLEDIADVFEDNGGYRDTEIQNILDSIEMEGCSY